MYSGDPLSPEAAPPLHAEDWAALIHLSSSLHHCCHKSICNKQTVLYRWIPVISRLLWLFSRKIVNRHGDVYHSYVLLKFVNVGGKCSTLKCAIGKIVIVYQKGDQVHMCVCMSGVLGLVDVCIIHTLVLCASLLY